jgi:subtilisin family serine protease
VSTHPALKGVKLDAYSFASSTTRLPTSHGTAIASLLASEGSTTIVSAGVFSGSSTKPFTSADAIGQALEWLVSKDVNVINISLAGPRNAILDALIRRSIRSGHAIVAAAGNGGPAAPPAYPAAVPGVIAVTAIDSNQRVYRYANQGPYIAFAARGVGIPAAAPGGTVTSYSGTSFATPLVSAHLARCVAGQGSIQTCVKSMERNARDLGAPGRDPVYGHGVIQP